ncbi:polyketide synthase-like protein [Dothistroma septosporum NZE10]|uniref:Polyketide synthase-like protein n=1 Tax=Dothistroma septosporum (strain NZE10 / CBS 128990) TaxID=675120 RepID=N1PGN9_DOTSN|nr:polyketide synthase-like protein [Dothistroma septosporum NZE10]
MAGGNNASQSSDHNSIAVVGVACRFPGEASSVEGFWKLLCEGRCHFLKEDISKWDANFFGITPEKAEAMGPQQRIMMEVAYEAFENAGITLRDLSGSNTGCWMGVNSNDWREALFRDPEAAPMNTWTGVGPQYISGRVSWFYNMRGPCMTVNTACSSSLVALHQACQSIKGGDCDTAKVGGANLVFNPEYYLFYSNQKFLSTSGKCKSFDADGDGFGRGEGFGAVIVKRVADAIRDGDSIRAIVRGTGAGQDGWTSGITLPNADAQAELIRRTYEVARLPRTATEYVEAHCTGTKVGDPAELAAVHQTLGQGAEPVLIGSVKTNIGHLEGAAGIAGVIKAILILERGSIPPTIGIQKLNPRCEWQKWRLRIADKLTEWPATEELRRISISSFGASGTIAHAILDDATSVAYAYQAGFGHPGPKLILISANDPASQRSQRKILRDYVRRSPTRTSWAHLPYRSCVIASNLESLSNALEAEDESIRRASTAQVRLGFIFTGQGAQWAKMGMELLVYPRADTYLQSNLGCKWSAMDELLLGSGDTHINQAEYSQPLCTVLQVALVDLLTSWDIAPTRVAGHSSGEIAAAYCLGALTADDAWTAAYWRGNVDKRSALPNGGMLAGGITPREATNYISQLTQGIAVVGCVNAPSSITLSGDVNAMNQLSDLLTKDAKFNRRLKVDTAYHSPHPSVVSNEYLMRIRDIRPKKAHDGRVMHSSVTGKPIAAAEHGPSIWVRNLVSTALFAQAVGSMLRTNEVDLLLEVGPHSALAAPVKSTMSACGIDKDYLSVLSRGIDGMETAMKAAAELLTRGVDVNVRAVNRQNDDRERCPLIDLPFYRWNHEILYWAQSRFDREYRNRRHPAYRFIGAPLPQLVANEHIWRAFIRPTEETWVVDHKLQGMIVYPAVGYVAMAIEAARQFVATHRTIRAFRLCDVRFLAYAEMNESSATEMTLCIRPAQFGDGDWLSFSISSCSDGESIKRNSTGRVRIDYLDHESDSARMREVARQDETICQRFQESRASYRRSTRPEAFYTEMARIGLEFGPAFRNIAEIRKGEGQSCCLVDVVNPAGHRDPPDSLQPFIIHPATFDPITQTIMAAAGLVSRTPIPIAIDELIIAADIPFHQGEQLAVFSHVQRRGHHAFLSDIHALEPSSQRPVLSLTGLKLAQIAGRSDGPSYHMCSRIEEVPSFELLRPEDVPKLATWHEQDDTLQQRDSTTLLDTSITYDVIALPKGGTFGPDATHKLVSTALRLLKPKGFVIANNPGDALEAALLAQGVNILVDAQTVRHDRFIIARSNASPTEVAPTGDIVILESEQSFTANDSVPAKLAQQLQQAGYRPIRVQLSAITSYGPLLKRTRCVSLVELGRPLITFMSKTEFDEVKFLLTYDPLQYAIDGMVLSIRNEDAGIRIRTLHLGNQPEDSSLIESILRVATADTKDNEFSTNEHGVVQVSRISADPILSDWLDTLHFVEDKAMSETLADDEVLLQVAYSGLNFKDIMIAMGRVAGTMEGAEGSGTIITAGQAVTQFKAGDFVICLSIGMHSSIAKVKADSCRPIPKSLDLVAAASLPVVHCTAYNVFVRIARPVPGQSVLIHAGAGGLGQVAIQYAQHFGMEIFVTVGSKAKRELLGNLYGIDDDHILNSRDTSFAMAIRRLTKGRGVDVVLNSLSGDMLQESWKVLAPVGTFVEVDKVKADSSHEVGATYSTFDVEHVIRGNPRLAGELFDGALDYVRRGITKAVDPRTIFPVSKIHEAVRSMQTGSHSGKILLTWTPEDIVPVLGDGGSLSQLRPDITYALVGGLGGIGRSLALMLVELGARHLCFFSRSGAKSTAAQALLEELTSQQINARAYACDVADRGALQETLARVAVEMPCICGVLQCAAVFRDATFAKVTFDEWQQAMRPKVQASWNIHELLRKDIDFFVLLSSFAGLFGNLGQTNYGAGSILAEQGMTENLQEWSCFGISEAQLQKLVRAVIQDQISGLCSIPPQVPTGIASRRAAIAAGIEPPFYLHDPRFAPLAGSGQDEPGTSTSAGPSFLKRLKTAKSSEEKEAVINHILIHKVAKCLAVPEDRIDVNRSLPAYGINSLVAIEIRNWILKEAHFDVAIFDLISPLPIIKLVAKIVKNLGASSNR